MRTLGIDPGSIKTGYGLVDERRGGGFVHVDCGIVAPDDGLSFAQRLHAIGDGLRRLVRDRCDRLLRLPMHGLVQSLNAAVAGSIALYAARAARRAPPATG